jgi:hypothetical protein
MTILENVPSSQLLSSEALSSSIFFRAGRKVGEEAKQEKVTKS